MPVSTQTVIRRSMWGWISIALVSLLVVLFVAACGGDNGDDDAASGDATNTTGSASGTTSSASGTAETSDADATESGDASGLEATASAAVGAASTMTGMDGEMIGAIGSCFEENTTPEIVTDLRAGNTDMAQEIYRGCLEDALPPAAVVMAEPMIETASECGVTSAEGLSDDEVAAMEDGDAAVIERVTTETIECLSTEFGDVFS